MPPKRGTRPTGPRPWPYAAEQARQSAVDAAALIATLARRTKVAPQTNIYATRANLAEIEAWAEHIQRLLAEARHGTGPDPPIATLGEAMGDLVARVADLAAEVAAIRAERAQAPPVRVGGDSSGYPLDGDNGCS